MKDVKCVFERDDTFLGRAIRWFTSGRVNHVAVTYRSEDWQSEWVVEALPKGVTCRPVRNRKWAYVVTPKKDVSKSLRAASDYLDRKYDFKGFFLFAIIILAWRWLRIKIRKPSLSGKAQICSEFATHVILLPVLGPVVDDPQWVHPEELLAICEQHPDFYTVEKFIG